MNNHTNLVRLRAVANALAHLNERVVFVGGATVGLYATDTAAPESRPTDDVDVIVEVVSYAARFSCSGFYKSLVHRWYRSIGALRP